MHPPSPTKTVPFPVVFKPYAVAGWAATREEMQSAFGPPHHVEIVSGDEEDRWAWVLASGQTIVLTFQANCDFTTLLCDPPSAAAALEALGIDFDIMECEPTLHPSFPEPT
jgi:hypothetical protein